MEGAIKVNSLMISFMEKESIYMRIKSLIKDNGFQTNMKVKEQEFMKMAASMRVTGLMMRDTVQVNIFQIEELFKMEFGRMMNLQTD